MLGKLDEIPEQICDKANVEINLRFLSQRVLSSSSSPPLARAVFPIFDNDGAFKTSVNQSLPVRDINLTSIYPELDAFLSGLHLSNSLIKNNDHYNKLHISGYQCVKGLESLHLAGQILLE